MFLHTDTVIDIHSLLHSHQPESCLVSDIFICIDSGDKFQSHQMETAKTTIEILEWSDIVPFLF